MINVIRKDLCLWFDLLGFVVGRIKLFNFFLISECKLRGICHVDVSRVFSTVILLYLVDTKISETTMENTQCFTGNFLPSDLASLLLLRYEVLLVYHVTYFILVMLCDSFNSNSF